MEYTTMNNTLIATSIVLFLLLATSKATADTSTVWGTNLAGVSDWDSTGAWIDFSRKFRRWGEVGQPWREGNFTLPFTPQGIPTEDFGTTFVNAGHPDGVYKMRFEGTAAVSMHGSARIVPGSIVTTDGVTSLDVEVGSNDSWINFRHVQAGDPVRNLQMISPGYNVNTTQVFRDEYLHRLKPFSTLRFMNWNRTNNSVVTSWDQRRMPGDISQADGGSSHPGKGGVAWEHMIQLANDAEKDAWINVPHLADDDYVRQLAQLWRDNYDPQRTLYVEWSNEPWNTHYSQEGNNGRDYSLEGNAASQINRIGRIFKEEFGAESDRLNMVLGAWSANDFSARTGMEYFQDHDLAPSQVIDSIAIAPYFREDANVAFPNLEKLFVNMELRLDQTRQHIRNHKIIADQYDLQLISYEGGQGLVPGNTSEGLMREAQNDPRMADLYRRFSQIWEEEGGGLFMHFNDFHQGRRSGFWGLLDDLRDPGSTRWDAVMGLLLPVGDATLDGIVTFDDYLVLEANFNQSDRWWEQGDTNEDNLVNGEDLINLYANIQDLIPLQHQHIREFALQHDIVIPEPGSGSLAILGFLTVAAFMAGRRRPHSRGRVRAHVV